MGLLWPALLVMFGLLVCHLLPYVHISWTILRSLDMLILMNSGCIFLSTSGHLYLHISRLIRGKTKFKSSMTPFFTETSLFFPLSGLLQNSSLSHTHTHTELLLQNTCFYTKDISFQWKVLCVECAYWVLFAQVLQAPCCGALGLAQGGWVWLSPPMHPNMLIPYPVLALGLYGLPISPQSCMEWVFLEGYTFF